MSGRNIQENARELGRMRNRGAQFVLGIDIGGSKILTAVTDYQGNILSSDYGATPAVMGPQVVIQEVVKSVRYAVEKASITMEEVSSVGIGAPGISNPETGVIFTSPNLPGWHNIPLKDIVEQELGIRAFLINDANAAALGEFHFGAGRGVRNLIYVTLSTGIGGGIIIEGELYSGTIGLAGEIGHMTIDVNGLTCECGNHGCWETLASGSALAREAKLRIAEGVQTSVLDNAEGDIEKVTARVIHVASEHGDSLAKELIACAGYYVGVGLANLINIFNPELIVIGGGLSNIGDMLLRPAFKVASQRAYREAYQATRFALIELGGNSGVLGAAAFALAEIAEREEVL